MKTIHAKYAALILIIIIPTFAKSTEKDAQNGLKNATVMIVRHAEKPDSGRDLSPAGQQRAEAYADYFKNLKANGKALVPDCLIATADSEESQRPRQTLEPLSKALSLKIDSSIKNKDYAEVAKHLFAKHHGDRILICWHHGEIPGLLNALGADPAALLPEGKWPGKEFGWVLLLRFDNDGHLIPAESKRINENLMPGDK